MAGMLPGVESARRRRFHQGGGSMNSSTAGLRRSSFCLYATGSEPYLSSNFLKRSSSSKRITHGWELGNVAREAKERLNEKLRTQRSTEIQRHNSIGGGDSGCNGRNNDGRVDSVMMGNVQREVFSLKKSPKKFCWSKLGWKSSEQKECAVCLENFMTGDILVHLQCAHRFHWNCAMPWIEANAHCPCCRMVVVSVSS